MDEVGTDVGLVQSLAALSKFGLRAGAAAPFDEQAAGCAHRATRSVVAAIPAFGISVNPEMHADLDRHAHAHADELSRLLEGGMVRDFAFVHEFAGRCLTQRFPIESTLQAYRSMLGVLSEWVSGRYVTSKPRDRGPSRLALAKLLTQYGGAISTAFSVAYVAHASVYAEAEGDRRAELLSILVGGFDEMDARAVRLLKRAGYLEQRLRFCVALVQAIDPLEMENTARTQRIADAMVECIAPLPVRVLVGVRNNLVTAVFSGVRRMSGWTAPQANLADRVKERLRGLGPSVLVGLSGDQASPSLIPRALHEATVTFDFATVSERVIPFYSLSI